MQPQAALKSIPQAKTAPIGAAIDLQPLRDSLRELEIAATKVADMQGAFSDLLRTVATKTGIAAPVIRSFIGARLTEEEKARDRKKQRASQLSLLFDEIA